MIYLIIWFAIGFFSALLGYTLDHFRGRDFTLKDFMALIPFTFGGLISTIVVICFIASTFSDVTLIKGRKK